MRLIIDGCKLIDLKSGQKDSGEPYFGVTVQYFGGQIRLKLNDSDYVSLKDKIDKIGTAELTMDYSENKWGVKCLFGFKSFVVSK